MARIIAQNNAGSTGIPVYSGGQKSPRGGVCALARLMPY
jgi:hypothetical protein